MPLNHYWIFFTEQNRNIFKSLVCFYTSFSKLFCLFVTICFEPWITTPTQLSSHFQFCTFLGSRSKKIRRILLPLLLLLKLKAAIILPIVLSAIALLSFKGFGISLVALAVAGTTALKNVLEHAGSKVSYEVVPTPVGHWSRSGALDDSLVNTFEYQAI